MPCTTARVALHSSNLALAAVLCVFASCWYGCREVLEAIRYRARTVYSYYQYCTIDTIHCTVGTTSRIVRVLPLYSIIPPVDISYLFSSILVQQHLLSFVLWAGVPSFGPVGRLDFDTSGVLIFTDDFKLKKAISSP